MKAFTEESYSPSLRAHWFRMAQDESETAEGSTVMLLQLYTESDVPGTVFCMSH